MLTNMLPYGGLVGPAVQDYVISRQHGQKVKPGAFMRNAEGLVTNLGFSTAGGISGAGVGALVGGLAGGVIGKGNRDAIKSGIQAGALAGGVPGAIGGSLYDMHRHGKKLHKLYSEKQAVMNELLESGVSFDEAVEMIKEASASE